MRIWENPPVKRRKKSRKGRRRLKRGPGGRFLKRSTRRKTRRKTKVRRHARRSGGTKMARKRRKSRAGRKGRKQSKAFYARIGRKGARTRARRKAARRASARKAARHSRRKPKYRRGRKTRPTLRRYKGRFYAAPGSAVKGRRINPRGRRRKASRRSYSRRRNPGIGGALGGLFPTKLAQFKDVALVGAGGAVGYLGVGMLNGLMDRVGVASLKDKVESPILRSVVNAVQSVVSTFILAGASRMVLKNQPRITQGIFAGGATKAILDIVNPFLVNQAAGGGTGSEVAAAALEGFQEQLSGYQYAGVSGFQETSLGASDGMSRIAALNDSDSDY